MNVFLREMKSHRWALLFWSLGMFAMVASGMAKYAAYESAGPQSIQAMLRSVPKGMQAVLGFAGLDLTTAAGFYGVLFLYIAVMGAVHSSLLGASVISEEERDRTSEFLYTKPASRSLILTAKLAAGVVNVVLLNLATVASSFYFVHYFNKGEQFDHDIWVMMLGLLILQLIFFSIGLLIAGSTHRPKAAPSRSTSIMFLTFLISFSVNLDEKLDFLRFFTPFKYFDAAEMMKHGLETVYVVLSALIIVCAIGATYRLYSARDLTV